MSFWTGISDRIMTGSVKDEGKKKALQPLQTVKKCQKMPPCSLLVMIEIYSDTERVCWAHISMRHPHFRGYSTSHS